MPVEESFSEIHEILRGADLSALEPLPLCVLRNVVVEPIEPYLRYLGYRAGCNVQVQFGDYDNALVEALGDEGDLLHADTACVLIACRLENLSWGLAREFPALDAERIREETQRARDFVEAVVAGVRRQTPAMILWLGFERPLEPALGVLDYNRSDGQTAVISALNEFVREVLGRTTSAYFLDVDACRARIGAKRFYDPRYWHIGRAPYSREGLREIACEAFKYIRALRGRSKKCLVLDCDGVLWGGIVGEDGLAGIQLGRTHPGSAHFELQQEVVNLHHRGVLIALCSNNDAEDVWEVFRSHPDMVLREEHVSVARIDWRDKPTKLREIAEELNLGLESLLFVDDSEFEVDLVRSVLPQIETLHLPKERSVEAREMLAGGGWFDTLTLTEEDRRRGDLYEAESHRKALRVEIPDLDTYYRSLKMVLEIRFADEVSIPRLAQLTQKTNQFNLSARRYSEEEIRRLAVDESSEVVGLRLKDRFGDSGVVGLAILRYEDNAATLDSFLLSCRVLGRGVEDALLAQCLKRARAKNCTVAVAVFRRTGKNQRAEGFYLKRGFRPLEACADIERFEIQLAEPAMSEPAYFEGIDSELEG
jgi:FkbH-like protein